MAWSLSQQAEARTTQGISNSNRQQYSNMFVVEYEYVGMDYTLSKQKLQTRGGGNGGKKLLFVLVLSAPVPGKAPIW